MNGISIRENTGSTATHESITRGDLSMNGILMWDNGKAPAAPTRSHGQAADFTTTSNADAGRSSDGTLGNGKNVRRCKPADAPSAGYGAIRTFSHGWLSDLPANWVATAR